MISLYLASSSAVLHPSPENIPPHHHDAAFLHRRAVEASSSNGNNFCCCWRVMYIEISRQLLTSCWLSRLLHYFLCFMAVGAREAFTHLKKHEAYTGEPPLCWFFLRKMHVVTCSVIVWTEDMVLKCVIFRWMGIGLVLVPLWVWEYQPMTRSILIHWGWSNIQQWLIPSLQPTKLCPTNPSQ